MRTVALFCLLSAALVAASVVNHEVEIDDREFEHHAVFGQNYTEFNVNYMYGESHRVSVNNKCGGSVTLRWTGGGPVKVNGAYTSNGPMNSFIVFLTNGCGGNGENCITGDFYKSKIYDY